MGTPSPLPHCWNSSTDRARERSFSWADWAVTSPLRNGVYPATLDFVNQSYRHRESQACGSAGPTAIGWLKLW